MFRPLTRFRRGLIAAFVLALLASPVAAENLISVISNDLGARRPGGCPSRWCACYLDKVLEEAGFKIRGSFRARGFAQYGKPAKPGRVGAIMVMAHHVGVVAGVCPDGRVKLLSGNYSHKVGAGCFSAKKAIAWRLPLR